MKTCTKCKLEKSLDNFYKDKYNKNGYACHCKKCRNKHTKSYRKKNSEKWQAYMKNFHLKANYGITWEEYLDLYNSQEGKCKICECFISMEVGSKLIGKVDHSHTTGAVRGLLCSKCNLGLGHFEDNIKNLASAIKYLETE